MTKEQHITTHKELHKYFDELIADFIDHTDRLPSETTVMELMEWSWRQCNKPDWQEGDDN